MRSWKKAISLILCSIILFVPIVTMAASGLSLDSKEREEYLKPDSTPMDPEPTVVNLQSGDVAKYSDNIITLNGNWLLAEGGTESNRVGQVSCFASSNEDLLPNLFDKTSSCWTSENATKDHWITVDMGVRTSVQQIAVTQPKGQVSSAYIFQGSQDGNKWTDILNVQNNAFEYNALAVKDDTAYRFYRLLFTQSGKVSVEELQFFSNKTDEEIISEGKSVEASDTYNGYPAENAVDGNVSTQWISGEHKEPHWLIVDLKEETSFNQIKIFRSTESAQAYRMPEFNVEVSSDKKIWDKVWTETDNTEEIPIKTFEKAIKARYVRLNVVKASEDWVPSRAARILEFQVLNSKSGLEELELISPNVVCEADSNTETLYKLFDKTNDPWVSKESSKGHWITLDLGKSQLVAKIKVKQTKGNVANEYTIRGSNDGETWETLSTVTNGDEVSTLKSIEPCRYFKISFPSAKKVSIEDLTFISGELLEKNISQGKSVQASTEAGGFPATAAVDGKWNDWGNIWIANSQELPHWLTVDLGEKQTFSKFNVYTCLAAGEPWYRPLKFKVQTSDDKSNWSTVWDAAYEDGEAARPVTGYYTYSLKKPVSARYVRLLVDVPVEGWVPNKAVRIAEFQVISQSLSVKKEKSEDNIAAGKSVTASSELNGFPAGALTDERFDNWNNIWISESSDASHWAVMDIGEKTDFNQLKIFTCGSVGEPWYRPLEFKVQTSDDNKKWDTVWEATYPDGEGGRPADNFYCFNLPEKVEARYIRLYVTKTVEDWVPDKSARIAEVQIMKFEEKEVEIPLMASKSGWSDAITAVVPGSIHTALFENGIIPDPFDAKNDAIANAQSQKTWWYRNTFEYTGTTENVRLNFEGVCNEADFWLNGVELGSHEGMFGGPYYDVSNIIVSGKNTLTVRLHPAKHYTDTVVFNCTDGWHYAQIWPLGIWNDVSLEVVPDVEIVDPFIAAKDANAGIMDLSVELSSRNDFEGKLNATIRPKNFKGQTYSFSHDFSRKANENKAERLQFTIPDPKLWWPSGYGEQNLYWLDLELTDNNGNVIDSARTSFAIRTIEMKSTPNGERDDQYNWTFVVNGKPLFLKGTGWCTCDALMRFTKERYEQMLTLVKDQGVQLMRAWGGGLPETDTFYDLCDEYGIAIYQEWPTCWDSYKSQPESVLYETVILNTKRLRNHPSLFMWGGGNEGTADINETVLNKMGKLTLENDGTRPWHRQDMYGYNSSHNYDTYWGNKELDAYLTYSDGFIGEFGLASMPNMESIQKYATKEEIAQWPIKQDDSVMHHTPKFGTATAYWGKTDVEIMTHFAEKFIDVNSVENLIKGSQLAQSVGLRHTLELARSSWPNSTGICYYKMNDVYPGASWSTVDWYGSPKMSYYFVQDAYQSLAAVGNIFKTDSYGEDLSVPITLLDDNNELNQASWKVNVRAYNSALKLIKQESFDGNGSIDRTKKLGSFELNAEQTSTAPLFIVTEVEKNGTLASRNYSFINYEEEVGSLFILPRTSLSYTISDNTVTVKNDGKVPAVAVSFNTSDSTKMLPDDSYFWLEAGESKTVVMKDATLLTGVISWNNKDESNTTKPSSPTNLEAKSTEKGIKLSWDTSKDKDVIGYNIYRDGELIDYVSLNNTSYIDKNVSANKTYSYTVRAVDAGDNLSEASNTATVKAEFDVGADISPKTGDRSHIVLFTILCFISIIVSLAFEGYIRRKDDIARAK